MRTRTLAVRILNQLRHDKRTVMLVLVAPLIIMTLIYFIFNAGTSTYKIGIVSAPDDFVQELKDTEDANIKIYDISGENPEQAIKDKDLVAAVNVSENMDEVMIYVDGTDASKAEKVSAIIKSAEATTQQTNLEKLLPGTTETEYKSDYVYGKEDGSLFDNFGAPLVGLIIFFLVFLLAGINFLGERTSGTLEKMLSTPIRRGEIVAGYTLGFAVLALVQTVVITLFVVYVLGLTVVGNIWYVFLITLLTAIAALTMGIFFSALARSEFQMVQFIPIVILPQVFLCGLFELSKGWEIVGQFMPLTYTTHGLREVMLRGNGFESIWFDCVILLCWSAGFMIINSLLLKRQRKV